MYFICDVYGQRGELGQVGFVEVLEKEANKLNLPTVKDFLLRGFSIDIEGLLREVRQMDWGEFGELKDMKDNFLALLSQCREVVILSDGTS